MTELKNFGSFFVSIYCIYYCHYIVINSIGITVITFIKALFIRQWKGKVTNLKSYIRYNACILNL